ncbi:NPP1 family protein [Streptomyces sp. NPDC002845]
MPRLDYDSDGCLPAAAVDGSGRLNGGLRNGVAFHAWPRQGRAHRHCSCQAPGRPGPDARAARHSTTVWGLFER